MSAHSTFVHLGVHSEYSLSDSIIRVNELIQKCVDLNMPAVGLTDSSNLYAAVKFYKQCIKQGIKPLIGAHIWVQDNVLNQSESSRLLVYAKNDRGYVGLCRLLSDAYLNNQDSGKPCVDFDKLCQYKGDIIVIHDAFQGVLARLINNENWPEVDDQLKRYQSSFGEDYYLEVRRLGLELEEKRNEAYCRYGENYNIGLVATNAVQFLEPDQFDLHEVKTCIFEGRQLSDNRRQKVYRPSQYFKSSEQMVELFHDLPQAIANTAEIAKKCNVFITLGDFVLPSFEVAPGMTAEEYLKSQAQQGLTLRLESHPTDIKIDAYQERLDLELGVINKMGFAGYFLIVADFILWARNHKIPVGPGRGSGAGSLVAYALLITDLDPLEHDLLFERFLNPERISMPDFDIDFCMAQRDKVVDYVADKYGREKVSQIITFGTMAAKAVLRDVGRVMGMGYGFVDKIAKLIPFEPGMTLTKALEVEPELRKRYEDEEEVTELLVTALALEGLTRNVGKHAAGVVIAPEDITEYTALYAEKGSNQPVSHFDKDDLEAVGLVKFDFLGLKTLTMIDWALMMVNDLRREAGESEIRADQIPHGDHKTYELLRNANTTAVFQLESPGMKDLITRLQPDKFDDLVALVALFRPGPLESGMVDDYVNRKHGREQVDYLHESIKSILEPTYGVILYQEQVMNIAQKMAGYTLGSADILRKAMGKKVIEIMAEQKQIFVDGAEKNGVDPNKADFIFSLIEKFAGYGFNKSHSACYALISYQTAWLKANYPAAFMASAMSVDLDNTDKVVRLIADARAMGLEITPPDINHCFYEFRPLNLNTILYGLGAIKGLGRQVIENTVAIREEDGEFDNLFDYCQRAGSENVNRRVLQSMVNSGALDCLGQIRSILHANIKQALDFAVQGEKNAQSGQSDLFGSSQGSNAIARPDYIVVPAWSDYDQLKQEKATLGFYLSGHPIAAYSDEIPQICPRNLASVEHASHDQTIVGLISAVRVMTNRRGDKFAILSLDDSTAIIEVAVFAKLYRESSEMLRNDQIIVAKGKVSLDDRTQKPQMVADSVNEIRDYRQQYATHIAIHLNDDLHTQTDMDGLIETIKMAEKGPVSVKLFANLSDKQAMPSATQGEIKLSSQYNIQPTQAIIERLISVMGANSVTVHYDGRRDPEHIEEHSMSVMA